MVGYEFIRLAKSDVWHFHDDCQHYRRLYQRMTELADGLRLMHTKPEAGELCNECLAKSRR